MAKYFTFELIIHTIFFQSVMLFIIISNLILLKRTRRHSPPMQLPRVSVLIPARNEAKVIERCVRTMLRQDYPNFELLVLDDNSEDETLAILQRLAQKDPRLQVLQGEALPSGFCGKNWACAQLAKKAQGELLYFTDADTFSAPNALSQIITAMIGERADMLSGFARQEVFCWGEKLLVPFFTWAANSFVPLLVAYQLHKPVFAIAVGQMMVFRRDAYFAIGGHEDLGADFTDDISLARNIISGGYRWRLAHISDLVGCRMYPNGRAAFRGFSNNFFAAFGQRLLPFVFAFIWIVAVFLLPLGVGLVRLAGGATHAVPTHLLLSMGLSILIWMIPFGVNGIPAYLGLLYPLNVLAITIVAYRSLWLTLTGKLTWKGRALTGKKIRWI